MALLDMQADLTIKMDEITAICKKYGFDAAPTILLMHRKGYENSVLISNSHQEDIIAHVNGLFANGNETEMSVSEAAIKQVVGGL